MKKTKEDYEAIINAKTVDIYGSTNRYPANEYRDGAFYVLNNILLPEIERLESEIKSKEAEVVRIGNESLIIDMEGRKTRKDLKEAVLVLENIDLHIKSSTFIDREGISNGISAILDIIKSK
jgi:hypothetical protein